VTDRAKGQDVTYDQLKPNVEQAFGSELQGKVVEEARKAAKITVKPMPADFFPKAANPTAPVQRTAPTTNTPASGKDPAP
jgi:peptidyl-prolyl cis-trans isomerase C